MEAAEILKDVEAKVETPFITARFGDNWREHYKRMLDEGQVDVDMILNIAWKQGRRVVLLERFIEQQFPNQATADDKSSES